MDYTGSPPSLWLLALKYTAFSLNHTSCPSLDKAIPMMVLSGVTHISKLLHFRCYEHFYFQEDKTSFLLELFSF